jgi:hypothetical protein
MLIVHGRDNMAADPPLGNSHIEAIVAEHFNYGKFVIGPEKRVQPGTGYSVTSRSRNLTDLTISNLAPSRIIDWMPLEPDVIVPASQSMGCLVIKRVLLGSNPDHHPNRCAVMRARFRREGGDGGGGRPYLQASVWLLAMKDLLLHIRSLTKDHFANMVAEPDRIDDHSGQKGGRVDPLRLEVPPSPQESLDEMPSEWQPAILEMLWSIRESEQRRRNFRPWLAGEEWFATESEFLDCAGLALSLIRDERRFNGLNVSVGLRQANPDAWFGYCPGERFERHPRAQRSNIVDWISQWRKPAPGQAATARRDQAAPLSRALSSHAPASGSEALRYLVSRVVETPRAAEETAKPASVVPLPEPRAPSNTARDARAGSHAQIIDNWVGALTAYQARRLRPTSFLAKTKELMNILERVDERTRKAMRGELSEEQQIVLDLVASGLGHGQHWTKLTIERASFLLDISEENDSADMRVWYVAVISALRAWFEAIGILTPSEAVRLKECRLFERAPVLESAASKALDRSRHLRSILGNGMLRRMPQFQGDIDLLKRRLQLFNKTRYPCYSIEIDRYFHLDRSQITSEIVRLENQSIADLLRTNG